MKSNIFVVVLIILTYSTTIIAGNNASHEEVSDNFISKQRDLLKKNTTNKGFGPQSPRDIDLIHGENTVIFDKAPPATEMNLCDIHFHKNAEHKGGEFTKYAGNGDGKGYLTGYVHSKKLTEKELRESEVYDESIHGGLKVGDTIETHYVYTTADVLPGPTLSSCITKETPNPELRVESQVSVLVNDSNADNFIRQNKVYRKSGVFQALNTPRDTGVPIEYLGSTTGPKYNEKGSPYKVTWNVRPKINKVNIKTVKDWLQSNMFNEDHAHGVRNLIINKNLLSKIAK